MITEEQADYAKKFIEEYKKSLKEILDRDIPDIDERTREDIVEYAEDFLNRLIQKGYLNESNLYERLERFKNNTKYFGNITGRAYNYGEYQGDIVRFNFGSETARIRMKHVLFHEWVHAITDKYIGELGEYRKKTPNTKPSRIKGFKGVIKRTDNFETIISDDIVTFIHEIIAEATACDLLDDYKTQRKTAFGSETHDITSDWITEYNTTYHQLGYEFLKTVFPNSSKRTDRELFKILTIKAMHHPYNLGQEIIDEYREKCPDTWKDDLHRITLILGNITNTHRIPSRISEIRELMKKYNRGFRAISRTDGENRTENRQETNAGRTGFRAISRTDGENRTENRQETNAEKDDLIETILGLQAQMRRQQSKMADLKGEKQQKR